LNTNQRPQKIAEIVTPPGIKPEVEVIFQTLDGLHKACPNNSGDWYFSGATPPPAATGWSTGRL
jgi:amidophosphoribosyltransferase